jgi:hypothetical protein
MQDFLGSREPAGFFRVREDLAAGLAPIAEGCGSLR